MFIKDSSLTGCLIKFENINKIFEKENLTKIKN